MRILVIDEGVADRKRTTDLLEQILPNAHIVPLGRRTDIAEALARGNFDLVFCEYRFSWTDGLALLRSIKHRFPQVPVVFVTLVYSVEVAMSASQAGLSHYVLKRDLDRQLPAVVSELVEAGTAPVNPIEQGMVTVGTQGTSVLGTSSAAFRSGERQSADHLRGVVGVMQAEISTQRRENEAMRQRLHFLEALLSSRVRSQHPQPLNAHAEHGPGPWIDLAIDLPALAKSYRDR